ncbi:MAG: bifunctional isocitrate dehydrogenase kinase/phosphatase [Gemmatimonadota bacterium]
MRADAELPGEVAALILAAFDRYHHHFRAISRRAKRRFETRDWQGMQRDSSRRLMLYNLYSGRAVDGSRSRLGERVLDTDLWAGIREQYRTLSADRWDAEIARTFFNSVTRRTFTTVGVRPDIEFLGPELDERGAFSEERLSLHTFQTLDIPPALVETVLKDVGFKAPFADLEREAELVAASARRRFMPATPDGHEPEDFIPLLEMIPEPFFRNKGAYLVGRWRVGKEIRPFVLALCHPEEGITVDALLTTSNDVSGVFGFSRSYFHADVDRPRGVVEFIGSILPHKRRDELYTSIGYNRHGKTELYRTLSEHLKRPGARFEAAEGAKGMVMIVFTLPSLNVVFKVIRDRIAAPKRTTRRAVRERYRLVFLRDRVGRLVDAQEFEGLEFPASRFADEVLLELEQEAGRTVRATSGSVAFDHLYTQRLMTPLDVYLRRADPEAARRIVLDYGQAIKDLAAANVFPGDFLLKNFGVTRHGRVIFYDYDELCLVTDCRFRKIPEAVHPEDELAAQSWFGVGEDDIFPEEFPRFLGLAPELLATFRATHGDLFEVEFWEDMQRRQHAGEIMDFIPYPASCCLRPLARSRRAP